MKKIMFVCAVLLAFSLACKISPVISNPPSTGNQPSGSQPSGNPPAATRAPEVQPSGNQGSAMSQVLFSDDFSDVNSGWDRVTKDYKLTDYDGTGAYRIWLDRTQFDVWATPYQNFDGDIVIEVDAIKAGGPDDNDFGVICRYTEDTTAQTFSFYYFIISSDGYAVIGRVVAGEQQWISSDQMQPSSAINTGATLNRIRAECVGSTLTLYVNGEKVTSVTDTNLSATGDVGLMAGTFDTGGVDILFDNFIVGRP